MTYRLVKGLVTGGERGDPHPAIRCMPDQRRVGVMVTVRVKG